jgi:TatA/E family protein of Tat protein translocase
LIVILVLALVLLGPNKLPDAASGLGKAIRSFRKATRDLTDQLDIDDEVKTPFRELKAALRDEPPPYVPPPAVAPVTIAPVAPPAGVVASAPIPSMTEAPAANVELPAHADAPKPDPKA